ncbi:hypothetical protein [Pseudoalteromonas sp. MMG005]|uniref:hypothetical protein n=1 Tax=Pseudoalteromonas sp. MMG005 TaxID=2822682 RepID=UPI001B3A1667|nr:hypothetical protein [Pseudoalteromonas sp. MMG005]MBQ4845380.1 hypothetical protein [Pseudoalteromonas sp. MMG005]
MTYMSPLGFIQKNFGALNAELLTDATISYINIASGFKGLLAPASYDDAAAITLLPIEISKVNGNGN